MPTFKTNRDGTLNELANHAYDLDKLWKRKMKEKSLKYKILKMKTKRIQVAH